MKASPLNITLDNDPQQIVFAGANAAPITLTLTNNDSRDATSVLVNAVRGDLLKKNDLTLTPEELAGGGYKVVDEEWVECRFGDPDAWQPIDEWTTPFDLGGLLSAASVSFEMRVNVPAASTDVGRMCFAIMISATAGEDVRTLSVTIDQTDFAITTGDTDTATATVTTDPGGDPGITWTSSNSAVATIDGSGVITAIAAGTAVIEAYSNTNPIARSSRFVVVSDPVAPSLVAGYEAWYDASDLTTITESGGLVSQWRDKSGNGYHLSEATAKPTTGAESLNSKNVINFSGSKILNGPNAAIPAGATEYTIFAVWKAIGANQALFHMGSDSTRRAVGSHTIGAGDNLRHYWWSSDLDSGAATFSNSTAHVVTYGWDSASNTVITRIDETEYSNSNSGKDTNAVNFALGYIPGYGFGLNGFIAEFVIYHTALSPAEIAQNEAYLKAKWGL